MNVIPQLQSAVQSGLCMLAGMELEIFTRLADGPRRAEQLAEMLGVSAERLARLLYALVVVGLLEQTEGWFRNSTEAATSLVKGRPGYLGGMHELLSQLWHADLRTATSIRTGKPAALHDFAAMSDEQMAGMLRGMHASAISAAHDLARHHDFSRDRSAADIGGGSGGLIAALCQAYPQLRGVLIELPRTVRLARPILEQTPGGTRVSCEEIDIVEAAPREQHDAVVLRALIQVLAPADAQRAIANAAAATRRGGMIFIMGGGILDDDRLQPAAAVLLNITLMNLYPAGGAYTEAEHASWLSAAGFGEISRIQLPAGGSFIQATRL